MSEKTVDIYLARHGQNVDNANLILNGRRDLPLTDLGRQQARVLALTMRERGLTFSKAFSSPLCRAFETGNIATDVLGMAPPEILPDLTERDFGPLLTGKPVADIEKYCGADIIKTPTITYFLSPEGAETFPELIERAQRVLAYIRSRVRIGPVFCSSHGDFGKMLYAANYGVPWREVLTGFHFGNTELLLLRQGGRIEDAHIIRVPQFNP